MSSSTAGRSTSRRAAPSPRPFPFRNRASQTPPVTRHSMELLERRVYRGPSLYAHFPVMRLTVDLGVLESWPSAKIPGFNDGLLAALPSLRTHTCSFESEGGFVRRLQEDGGTWLGHVLEHVAIE